jgi:hypothetical protein
VFDKETRRKPLMFAADAVISRSGLWVLNGVSGKPEQHPVLFLMLVVGLECVKEGDRKPPQSN